VAPITTIFAAWLYSREFELKKVLSLELEKEWLEKLR